jgi:hypothetical protein
MSLRKLFQKLHRDERGVVSLETVLIIAAIALPVLIIIIKFGWPRIREYFDEGLNELERETDDAIQGN